MKQTTHFFFHCNAMTPAPPNSHHADTDILHFTSRNSQTCMQFVYLTHMHTHTHAIFQWHVFSSARLLRCDHAEVGVGGSANILSCGRFIRRRQCPVLCVLVSNHFLIRMSSGIEAVVKITMPSVWMAFVYFVTGQFIVYFVSGHASCNFLYK